jgi:hypothetical protein
MHGFGKTGVPLLLIGDFLEKLGTETGSRRPGGDDHPWSLPGRFPLGRAVRFEDQTNRGNP